MTRVGFWRSLLVAIVGAGALAVSQAHADVVVLQDTFSGSGALNGRAPTTPQNPGNTWTDTASIFTISGGSATISGANYGQAQLPFAITSGYVYDLSADISSTSSWIGIGFQQGTSNQPPWYNSGLAPWAFIGSDGGVQAFASQATANQFLNTNIGGGNHHLDVRLDTTGAQWVVKVIVDNGSSPLATYTYPSGSNPTIDHVTMVNGSGSAGNLKNFTLSKVTSSSTVLQDTFSGTGSLNGRTPSTPQKSGDKWTDTATIFSVNSGLTATGTAGQAQLPFALTTGTVYDLSADINSTSSWIGVGYQNGTSNQPPWYNSGLAPWALIASDGSVQAFAGQATANQFLNTNIGGGGNHHLDVRLDTTAAQWVVKVFVDNSTTALGSYTYAAGSNPTIDHVTVTGGASVAGTLKNFTLTTGSAPPPPPPPPPSGPIVVAIGCGNSSSYQGSGSTSYTGGTGTLFSADQYFSGGTATSITTALNGAGYFDPTLYQHFRSGPCTYSIPVANGNYTVILGYCEPTATNVVGSRVFNVLINNQTVLQNFDLLANNRHVLTPVLMTFNASVTNGTLRIDQTTGTAGTPIISSIIVRTIPTVPSKISVGEYQMFYLVSGQIYAGGSNRCDEAGYPDGVGPYFPCRTIPTPAGVTFSDVFSGGYHSIALDSSGNVWAWGGNGWGQIGVGTTTGPNPNENYYPPTQILTDNNGHTFNNVKQIGCGFSFNAALKNDGTIWVWGSSRDIGQCGDAGILGDGNLTEYDILRPTQVPVFTAPGVTITQISCGNGILMALDSTGAVWSWGGGNSWDSYFSRGTQILPTANFAIPTKLAGDLLGKTVISVTNGGDFVYAIDSNHNLYCWGMTGDYMCKSSGTTLATPTAMNYTTLAGLQGHVKQVVVSWFATHVLLDDGTVWGWGHGCTGEVGNGIMQWSLGTIPPPAIDQTVNLVLQPVQILSGVANVYGTSIGGGNFAVKTDGTIWSWGFDKTTYLGNGIGSYPIDIGTYPDYFNEPTPMQVCPY